MSKNTVIALIAAIGSFASASFAASTSSTNDLPTNSISIQMLVDKKDTISIHGDKVWIAHAEGNRPSNIHINNNTWTPIWNNEEVSDSFTMENPRRFFPTDGQKRNSIFVSIAQTNDLVATTEYPDESNDWILTISLNNTNIESVFVSMTISWKEKRRPIVVPVHFTTTTSPSPTPVGLR